MQAHKQWVIYYTGILEKGYVRVFLFWPSEKEKLVITKSLDESLRLASKIKYKWFAQACCNLFNLTDKSFHYFEVVEYIAPGARPLDDIIMADLETREPMKSALAKLQAEEKQHQRIFWGLMACLGLGAVILLKIFYTLNIHL